MIVFSDGDPGPEIRRKLNEMVGTWEAALENAFGPQGWSPVLSVATDGTRRVFQVVDWVGGEGTKPTLLGYIGSTDIVADIAQAVDVRGASGPANTLAIGTVTSGVSPSATITGTAPNQTLNLVLQKGDTGNTGWSPVFAVVNDGTRRVQQVVDWTGGQGTKPTTGQYVGAIGLVASIASAVDIRGPAGTGSVSSNGTIVDGSIAVFEGTTGSTIRSFTPAVIAAGATAADARTAIGAGTSNLALGTTAGTALAGDTAYQVPLVSGTNLKTVNGNSLLGSGGITVGDVTLTGTETLTNKTLTAPTLASPVLGTPASGNLSKCTVDGTNKLGFKEIPQNNQTANYTLILTDSGKHIHKGGTTAYTVTIPANSSVAFPIGTAVTFVNSAASGNVTISITTDTMRLAGAGTTGSRTLAPYGVATVIKVSDTLWMISGSGIT